VEHLILFYILLFIVAVLYASVGHGGASGYLALMALFAVAPAMMKPTALMLNLFVSLTSFIQFYRGRHFRWKIFLPLALASIPMAFAGGLLTIEADIYKKILGTFLLIPVLRFFLLPNIPVEELRTPRTDLSVIAGAAIGFLSGLIGIGGGILLSPILLMLKWTDQKQAAAISALFIFVNSLSGLAGQLSMGVSFRPDMILWVGIAFTGGLLGAWLGALRFDQRLLRYVLASVLLLASLKLLFS
jgi:uncharacterized protein